MIITSLVVVVVWALFNLYKDIMEDMGEERGIYQLMKVGVAMSRSGNLIEDYLPTEKDFSSGAVQKFVLKETIQKPATIIPVGIGGGFTILMALGLMAVTPVTLVVPIISGLIGAGSWVYNYGFRGKELAASRVQKLRARLEQVRLDEVHSLTEECRRAGFEEGCKETGELEAVYQKLRTYLEIKSKSGENVDSASRYLSLAKDIYKEGIRLIRSALEAHKALKTVDIAALRRDRDSYQRKLAKIDIDSSEYRGLEAKKKNHDGRIAIYERHSEAIHQRMAQLEELEGALESSYLELVDLAHGGSLATPGESVSRLEQAVQAARKVEDMLRGEDTSAEDQVYLEAGKNRQLRQ